MSRYHKVIYSNKESDYPEKLCKYLLDRYLPKRRINNIKVLDIGCGTGTHVRVFKDLGVYYSFGVDNIDPLDVKLNNYYLADLNKDDLSKISNNFGDKFDFILLKSVLEHLENPQNVIKSISDLLNPGGVCVIMIPDWISQQRNFWDDPTHIKPYTEKTLQNLLKMNQGNWIIEDLRLMYQLPFTWNKSRVINIIPKVLSLLPDWFKKFKIVRFSKEKMILGVIRK